MGRGGGAGCTNFRFAIHPSVCYITFLRVSIKSCILIILVLDKCVHKAAFKKKVYFSFFFMKARVAAQAGLCSLFSCHIL